MKRGVTYSLCFMTDLSCDFILEQLQRFDSACWKACQESITIYSSLAWTTSCVLAFSDRKEGILPNVE